MERQRKACHGGGGESLQRDGLTGESPYVFPSPRSSLKAILCSHFNLKPHTFLGRKSWQHDKVFELARTSIKTLVYFCNFYGMWLIQPGVVYSIFSFKYRNTSLAGKSSRFQFNLLKGADGSAQRGVGRRKC